MAIPSLAMAVGRFVVCTLIACLIMCSLYSSVCVLALDVAAAVSCCFLLLLLRLRPGYNCECSRCSIVRDVLFGLSGPQNHN